jgi:hypothetical protein
MLLYILGFFILCIMLFFMYIRIKYPFWAMQPVFHFYDIYYWFINIGIIREELPEKNRYVNLKNIKTINYEQVDNNLLTQFVILIQLNYLRNNDNIFKPLKENIVPYFVGHSSKTFWSFYNEKDLLIDNKTNLTIEDEKIIAVITSRPLHVKINTNNKVFDVYYVDYLCVNKGWRKKNIAPQLIQTHEYNQSHLNKKICVSLFKREEELTGIIPLTVYKTYCFNMRNWGQPQMLEARIGLLDGDKQNMYYLYNFINETANYWDIMIYPEISNLIELVSTKNILVKMLVINTNIEAVYIFRKSCTFIEKGKEALSCIASIKGHNISVSEFIQGFKIATWTIIKTHRNYQFLIIEDISNNNSIINNISIKTYPTAVSPTAYFFYNFAYSPFKNNKCFIIN